jgi:hypothetical protein
MTDTLFPEPEAEALAPRGERGKAVDSLLDSGVRVLLSAERVELFSRAAGCIDRVLAVRDAVRLLEISAKGREPPSTDVLVESAVPLSDSDAMLGLLR